MGLLEKIAAMRAANTAVKTPKLLAPLERQYALEQFKAGSADPRQFYHGTTHLHVDNDGNYVYAPATGIKNFYEPGRKDFHSTFENGTIATFLSPEPEFSNQFAKSIQGSAPAVYPVHAQVKNPFDFANPEHISALEREYIKRHLTLGDEGANSMTPNNKAMMQRIREGKIENFKQSLKDAQKNPTNWVTMEDPQVQDVIKNLGHDAFYVTENGVKNLGVYNPNQIKSSIGNRGTFDINEPDMTKRQGGVVHAQDGGFQGGGYPYPRGYINYPTSQDEHSRNKGLPAEFYRMGQTNPAIASMSAGVGVPMGAGAMTVDALGNRTATAQGNFGGMNAVSLGYEHPVGEGTVRGEMIVPMQDGSLQKPANYNISYRQRFAGGGQVAPEAVSQSPWWQDMLDNSLAGGHIDDLTHSLGKAYFEKENG